MMLIEPSKLRQIVQKLSPQAELRSFRHLEGGVSARITALELAPPIGVLQTVVVRQHGRDEIRRDPDIARHEFQLLQVLYAKGLPVPRPLLADDSGDVLPEPYLVVEFVPGEIMAKPADVIDFVTQMATVLATIHTIDLGNAADFLTSPEAAVTERLDAPPPILDESLSEGRIRNALAGTWPPSQRNKSVLLHGDYWPGNTMWRDGRLVSVLDWEDAAFGDPLADLANARLEIMMHFGVEALSAFTDRYRALAPTLDETNLPLWDLWSALRPAGRMRSWGLEETTLRRFRSGHSTFVDLALNQLAAAIDRRQPSTIEG